MKADTIVWIGCAKKGKRRAPYPAEFRARIVDLVKAGGTTEELAREFEPSVQTRIKRVAGGYRCWWTAYQIICITNIKR